MKWTIFKVSNGIVFYFTTTFCHDSTYVSANPCFIAVPYQGTQNVLLSTFCIFATKVAKILASLHKKQTGLFCSALDFLYLCTKTVRMMKIVVLDGFTANPGDLPWTELEQMGQLTVYERTKPDETVERAKDAEMMQSPSVRQWCEENGVELITYRDLI